MNSDYTQFTNHEYGMPYVEISSLWEDAQVQAYCSRVQQKVSGLTKNWSNDLHSEWVTRHYLAVKMILSSTVMLTSYDYASQKNLKIVEPYLLYYAALSCCRALILTLPNIEFKDGELSSMTHQKIINIVSDHLRREFPKLPFDANQFLEHLRVERELFSYRFPAQGMGRRDQTDDYGRVLDLCRLLAENAELNSECLEASFKRNVTGTFEVNPQIVEFCFAYGYEEHCFFDGDDLRRIDYVLRKMSGPYCLRTFATQGLVEDFFGSWRSGQDDEGSYDPDQNWELIFPFD